MSSALPKVVLIVLAVIYGLLGLAFLFFTELAVGLLPITGTDAGTLTELAAMYGGLEIALAGIFVWGAWRPGRRRAGLVLAAATFAGLALGRSIGMMQFAPVSAYNIGVAVLEYIGLLFSLLGLWKHDQNRRGMNKPKHDTMP